MWKVQKKGNHMSETDWGAIRALEEADAETGPRWGKYRAKPASIKAKGMYYFAAHTLIMWKREEEEEDAGTAYAVSSKSVGDESTSFAVPSVTTDDLILNGDLPLTSYGVKFLRLRRRASAGPAIVWKLILRFAAGRNSPKN